MTREHGFAGPVQSPAHPVNADPDAGVAMMLTVAPSAYAVADGVAATVPLPAPVRDSVSVNVMGVGPVELCESSGHAVVVVKMRIPARAERNGRREGLRRCEDTERGGILPPGKGTFLSAADKRIADLDDHARNT